MLGEVNRHFSMSQTRRALFRKLNTETRFRGHSKTASRHEASQPTPSVHEADEWDRQFEVGAQRNFEEFRANNQQQKSTNPSRAEAVPHGTSPA